MVTAAPPTCAYHRRLRGPAVDDAFMAAAATLASSGRVPPETPPSGIIRPIFPSGDDAYVASVMGVNPTAEVGSVAVPILLVPWPPGAQTDHNLAIAGGGQDHSNTRNLTHRPARRPTPAPRWPAG